MTARFPARAFVHFIPGALVLAGLTWTVTHAQALPPPSSDFVRYSPYVVFAAGLLLSAAFHRSRIFHTLLLLFTCDLSLLLTAGHLSTASTDLLVRLLALALPLNLVLISFLPESGIVSRQGLFRLAVLALEGAATAIAIRFYAAKLVYIISVPFVQWLPFASVRGLPHSAVVAFTLGFLLLLLPLVRRRFRPTDIGLFWALVSGFSALCVAQSARLSSVAFAAGAVVLVIALLEAFYAMAYFDELTDLPSRRSFNDAKLRLGNTYTVAMVDVDHFKRFNDTFGHDAGDQVLRMVASRIAQVSGGGKGYRYGGEEFAVLFPGKCVDETFPHLERLRRSIEELPFKLRSKDRRKAKGKKPRIPGSGRGSKRETHVTVSIGAAGVVGQKRKPDDMVKSADKALYKAKSYGRNCTVVNQEWS
ncbi:MAG TPA: GGDEF domain-containing protein [Terriglobales bacterium]|nr:GGDEF domain-containing protein [Terriglobales bacterium]